MKRLPNFILMIFVLTLGGGAPLWAAGVAGDYVFRSINVSNGLSDSEIRSISYAPNGLVCIRTSRSLNIYDGATFAQYYYNYEAVPYNENTGIQQDYFDSEGRMWLKETDKLWVFDFERGEFIYDIAPLLSSAGIEIAVKSLFVDDIGNYWIVDSAGRLHLCDIKAAELTAIDSDPSEGKPAIPVDIARCGDLYWILYDDHIIKCWDRTTRSFIYRESGLERQVASLPYASTPRRVEVTAEGDLWILYSQALYRYDTAAHKVSRVAGIDLLGSDQLNSMALDAGGDLWLASSKSGLRIIDGGSGQVRQLPHLSLTDGNRITHNTDLTTLHIDPHGGVWIATITEGILYYHESMNKFSLVNNRTLGGEAMPDENIKCIVEDGDGTLLLGTVRGLLRYDPASKRVRVAYPELADELCTGLYRDSRGRIWLGTFQNGAFCIDGDRVRHYRYEGMPQVHISYYNSTPNLNNVRTFFEDRQGRFWISVYGGLGRFDTESGSIELLSERFPQIARHMVIRNIHYATDGLLVAASDNGMFLYDPEMDEVYSDGEGFPSAIPGTRFNCTMTDSRGLVWLGTFDGLFIWDPATGATHRVDAGAGLPNNNIYGIKEDAQGRIWASTFSHLTRIEVSGHSGERTFTLSNFNSNEGVQDGAFFEHSVVRTSDGRIWFGGSHGVNIVDPENIVYNTITNVPRFTALYLFNNPVEMEHKGLLTLGHKQNFISIDFSGLNYVNPAQTYFRYQLEGLETRTTEITSNTGSGRATYTSLPPGRYTFRVWTAGNDKAWGATPAVMEIVIRPPVWATVRAQVVYVLLAALVLWGIFVAMARVERRRREERLQREALRQREELDQMKFRFFTNISHELRTPLTLIITPLDTIVKRVKDSSLASQLGLIRRNAEQLLGLVNQLLDFRKLEMGGETLRLSGGYIAVFAEEVFAAFRTLAAEKMINYEFDNRLGDNPYIHFDGVKMRKILNNLLGNAFKFTPGGGSITLTVESDHGPDALGAPRQWIVMSVADTGIGIRPEELEHIFERFYQATDCDDNLAGGGGSGIGLHMIKEYAVLHGGEVSVRSKPGAGTAFTVRVPADLHPDADTPHEPEPCREPEEQVVMSAAGERKTVLLVEDSEEFRHWVKSELKSHYNIIEARDGREGIRLAGSRHPDLIVTDIMMPGVDGVELCRMLKGNIETSHIPIILLTARSSDEDKMEGYEAGADAYIAKPFNFDILLLRIRKLIDQAEKRRETFTKTIEVNPGQITITSLDEQLLQKALECVERNMSNPDYSVEDLSRDVKMHRMSLYRKLQSVVGQTPSEFIRTIRLKRAAQLLQKSGLPVVEIAEMVGFNTPKYFSRYFRELFGITPSQYVARFKP